MPTVIAYRSVTASPPTLQTIAAVTVRSIRVELTPRLHSWCILITGLTIRKINGHHSLFGSCISGPPLSAHALSGSPPIQQGDPEERYIGSPSVVVQFNLTNRFRSQHLWWDGVT